MKVIAWDTPIKAEGHRSLELESVRYQGGTIEVRVAEETHTKRWLLRFGVKQALRVTTWESSHEILRVLPDMDGGCYEMIESPLLKSLGSSEYMKKARHFVICCYDEMVEVVAWDASIQELSVGKEQ